MSLTSFLQNNDVRAMFSQEFAKPKLSLRKEILAPPVTEHYGLVGTAFDYLLRFYIERLNPQAITHKWVAEEAVEKMKEFGFAFSRGYRSVGGIENGLLVKGGEIVSQAKAVYLDYLGSGVMNDDVIKAALLLAQLGTYFVTGIIDEDFGIVDEGDIADLRKLGSIINADAFRAKELCVLNPTFGNASDLVGGADADLVIDDMLIDIKTTSRLEVRRDDFNCLVGYYILFEIGGVDGVPSEHKIERLGVYSSRYAETLIFSIREVIDERRMASFIEWFTMKAQELYGASRQPQASQSQQALPSTWLSTPFPLVLTITPETAEMGEEQMVSLFRKMKAALRRVFTEEG